MIDKEKARILDEITEGAPYGFISIDSQTRFGGRATNTCSGVLNYPHESSVDIASLFAGFLQMIVSSMVDDDLCKNHAEAGILTCCMFYDSMNGVFDMLKRDGKVPECFSFDVEKAVLGADLSQQLMNMGKLPKGMSYIELVKAFYMQDDVGDDDADDETDI